MIAELSASMLAALEAGDLAAARVAHEAIGRLLAHPEGEGAEVLDLAALRRERGER